MSSVHDDIPYQLALSDIKNLGPNRQVQLIERLGSARAVFDASRVDLEKNGWLTVDQVDQLHNVKDIKDYATRIKQWNDRGIQVVSFQQPAYPRRLLQIASFPSLLYYCGDLSVLDKQILLAVVGTRRMTVYGKKVLEELMPAIVGQGVVIVSGMAFGVDVLSHRLCLQQKGKTVAVQAQGVDRGYPYAHQGVYRQILEEGGCVCSEYPFLEGGEVEKFHFPRRNRLVSGMSDGVLVVEAGVKSGALITARYALDQNREVFAVPGTIHQKESAGCLYLMDQGARVVTSSESVLEGLGLVSSKEANQAELFVTETRVATDCLETGLEKKIYEICRAAPLTMDTIIDQTTEAASFVSATITRMQLMGRLKELEGRRFVAVL